MRNFKMTETSDINIFNVHYKTLELTNYEMPNDRCTYYQINENLKNKDHLLDYCEFLNPLCNYIYWLSQDFFEDKAAEQDSYEDIEQYFRITKGDIFIEYIYYWDGVQWMMSELTYLNVNKDDYQDKSIPVRTKLKPLQIVIDEITGTIPPSDEE